MDRESVVVIAGSAGALGRALARAFGDAEVRGIVLCDLAPARAHDVTAIERSGAQVLCVSADVTDPAAMQELAERTKDEFGSLDVLVNNAGTLSSNGRVHNLSIEEWRSVFEVNLFGVVNGIKAVVPIMRTQGSGSIINTGSVSGMTAWSHSSPYGASKAAVIHLTKIAAVEYAADGIRVNCVCPGAFESAMLDRVPAEAVDVIARRHPLGLGSAADLVGAYLYLAGSGSQWTTGSVIVVDGGYSAP